MSSTAFSSLDLPKPVLDNLQDLGYQSMTPVQSLSLPAILANQDVIAQGKTGSGKTVAFGLGVVQKLNPKLFKPQALVICPTRELADQVAQQLRQLARALGNIKVLTLCGGVAIGPQIGSLAHGAHIVVGTPGRLEAHLRKSTLKLNHLHTLVLDEADRMLDMGFEEAIDKIVAHIPNQRQTLLFSATYPDEIASIANRLMQAPLILKAAEPVSTNIHIKQYFYQVGSTQSRLEALKILLAKHRAESALVFCNTKLMVKEVAQSLEMHGFYVMATHGDLDQVQRDEALIRFANGSVSVLVATDVAARGLDVDDLALVINFEPSSDPEVHTHRIGRTGRAGKKGVACTLFSNKELHRLKAIGVETDTAFASDLPGASYLQKFIKPPLMRTLKIDGGKKQKLRPGDIVGALTAGEKSLNGNIIGKINVYANHAYVALESEWIKPAVRKINSDKIKGKKFKARALK